MIETAIERLKNSVDRLKSTVDGLDIEHLHPLDLSLVNKMLCISQAKLTVLIEVINDEIKAHQPNK